MADGRANNGGARKGSGRKPKSEEQKVRKLGINAIEKVYGSIEEYYEWIAIQSRESFPHLKLLQEYVFGKPKETIEQINHNIDREPTKEEAEAIVKALQDRY